MADEEQKLIFSKNLNALISNSSKTQKEIADAIGVSPQTFNTWCQGIALPRMGKVQKLADYFHVQKSNLIDETEQVADSYYIDDDVRELAQFLHDSPEYKVLFDASRRVKKEDIEFVMRLIDKFGDDN